MQNDHVENFNAQIRDEKLDGKIFYALTEVRGIAESWRASATLSVVGFTTTVDKRSRQFTCHRYRNGMLDEVAAINENALPLVSTR